MAKSIVKEKLEKLGNAISIVTLVLIAFPFILSFIQSHASNIYIVSITSAIVLLFTLAPIPAIVEGLVAFIADSRIPILEDICKKSLSRQQNRTVEFCTFYIVGIFVVVPIGVMLQTGAEKINLFGSAAQYIPLSLAFLLLLITIWLIFMENLVVEEQIDMDTTSLKK